MFEWKDQIGSGWAAIWSHAALIKESLYIIREKMTLGQTGEKERREAIKTGKRSGEPGIPIFLLQILCHCYFLIVAIYGTAFCCFIVTRLGE